MQRQGHVATTPIIHIISYPPQKLPQAQAQAQRYLFVYLRTQVLGNNQMGMAMVSLALPG